MVKNYNSLTQAQKMQAFALWQVDALNDSGMDCDVDRYNFDDFDACASFANLEYLLDTNDKVVDCLG